MKLLLVVLLLCLVFVVKGGDPCFRGEDAIRIFMDFRECGDLQDQGRDIMLPFFRNATLDTLRNAVSGYCSVVFPALRNCFKQNIQICTADQRAVLTRVVEETGFVCQPNSDTVHPNFAHLLTHFSDADFEGDGDCAISHSMHEECSNEALAAMGFASFSEFRDFLRNATVEEMMPYVPIFLNTLFECATTAIRDMPDRCDNWRGRVIHQLRWSFFPTVLGRTMTFTKDQLDEMFEFQDEEESGTGQSAQSFLSMAFKGP